MQQLLFLCFCVRDRSPQGREGRPYPAHGPLGGKIAARFRVKPGMTWELSDAETCLNVSISEAN